MNRFFAANLIFLDILLFGALPLTAQSIEAESTECRSAIASVENQLQSDRNLTIELSEMEELQHYPDHPQGRPNEYGIGMSGDAVRSVMSSPVLLDNLATQIIDGCNSVSSISFGQWQSGWFWVYGLMPDGEVEMFKCPEDHFHGGGYRDLVWGESCPV